LSIAGLLYLKYGSFPEPKYNPHRVATQNFELTDYDRDGDVDVLLARTSLDNVTVKTYYADDMVEILRDGNPLIDYMGYKSPRISREMGNLANLALNGGQEDHENLVTYLRDISKEGK